MIRSDFIPDHSLVPITALEGVQKDGLDLLFVGSGSVLHVFSVETACCSNDGERINHANELYDELCVSNILFGQAIHHILPVNHRSSIDQVSLDLLVSGGGQVVWVSLTVSVFDARVNSASLDVVGRLKISNEWTLDTRILSDDAGEIACLSSYNTVRHIIMNKTDQSLIIELVSDDFSTFLYSGAIAVIGNGKYIIVSGTALGEVLVWTCSLDTTKNCWIAQPWRQFEGHNGSIFGVSISPSFVSNGKNRQIVASCSDDRSIRLWDISDLTFASTSSVRINDSAFVKSRDELAMIWGHQSRIWTVTFLNNSKFASNRFTGWLLSTGEDGTIRSWSINLDKLSITGNDQLQAISHVYRDHNHTGKNIWSHCSRWVNDQLKVYSGGADGRVIVRSLDPPIHRASQLGEFSGEKCISISDAPTSNLCQTHQFKPLKAYHFLGHDLVIATTDGGHLLQAQLTQVSLSWNIILSSDVRSQLLVAVSTNSQLVFHFDRADNFLKVYNVQSGNVVKVGVCNSGKVASIHVLSQDEHDSNPFCLAVCYHGTSRMEVWQLTSSHVLDRKLILVLPDSFSVSTAIFDKDSNLLICGSRAGALAVFSQIDDQMNLICCARHVHGSDTITQIIKLEKQTEKRTAEPLYLTTGRDGTYSMHRLDRTVSQLLTVHRSTPPFGPYIEGAHIARASKGDKRLILHGFRSTDFVVWDETTQRQLFSTRCGGAHRSWGFRLAEYGDSASFIWTQAGSVKSKHWTQTDHELVRDGGHGREIKALAIHHINDSRWLFATGAEDTDIHLMLYDDLDKSSTIIAVIRKHTTGLQDLKFSENGSLLFSAAGMEELYAWQLTPIPLLSYGILSSGSLAREGQSDARIMSIDVRIVTDERYEVMAAFSNGKLKLLQYETSLATFTCQQDLDFGSLCLTQVSFTPRQRSLVISAATNGCIYFTKDMESEFTTQKAHQNSVTSLQLAERHGRLAIFTAGDDNSLALMLKDVANMQKAQRLRVLNAHAAAVTALDILENDDESFMVVTASNDQHIKLWRFRLTLQAREPTTDDLIKTELCEDRYTNVADISQIAILQPAATRGADRFEVVVVGVGLEVLQFNIV